MRGPTKNLTTTPMQRDLRSNRQWSSVNMKGHRSWTSGARSDLSRSPRRQLARKTMSPKRKEALQGAWAKRLEPNWRTWKVMCDVLVEKNVLKWKGIRKWERTSKGQKGWRGEWIRWEESGWKCKTLELEGREARGKVKREARKWTRKAKDTKWK